MRLRELRVMGQFNRHGSPRLPGLRNHASEGCRAANRSIRSEEHTSELQSHSDLVCRLLLEKKKKSLTFQDAHWTRQLRRLTFPPDGGGLILRARKRSLRQLTSAGTSVLGDQSKACGSRLC